MSVMMFDVFGDACRVEYYEHEHEGIAAASGRVFVPHSNIGTTFENVPVSALREFAIDRAAFEIDFGRALREMGTRIVIGGKEAWSPNAGDELVYVFDEAGEPHAVMIWELEE